MRPRTPDDKEKEEDVKMMERFGRKFGMMTLAVAVAVMALAAVSFAAPGWAGRGYGMMAQQAPANGVGPYGAFTPGYQIIPQALGMTVDEYVAARQGGKSVEAIAKEKGIALDTVIQKVLDARKPALEQLVKNGTITQEEMDLRLKLMAIRLERNFKNPAFYGGFAGRGMMGGGGPMMRGGCPMMGGFRGGYGI